MAKNQICKKTPQPESQSVLFEFANGENLTVSASDFTPEMVNNFLCYGISQKLGDSYAGADGPDEAVEVFTATRDQCLAGEWKVKRGGGGAPRTTMLVEALIAVTNKSEEEAQTVVAGLDDDGKKDLKAHPQIAAAIAKISAERAAAKAAKAAEAAKEAPALNI